MKSIIPPSPLRSKGRLIPATASRRHFVDPATRGLVHLSMLGVAMKMTPGKRPITVSESFNLAGETWVQAAQRAARKYHGQHIREQDLTLMVEYRVDPKAKAPYSRVFIARNDSSHEKTARSLRGIEDMHCNPFIERPSWYLWPI